MGLTPGRCPQGCRCVTPSSVLRTLLETVSVLEIFPPVNPNTTVSLSPSPGYSLTPLFTHSACAQPLIHFLTNQRVKYQEGSDAKRRKERAHLSLQGLTHRLGFQPTEAHTQCRICQVICVVLQELLEIIGVLFVPLCPMRVKEPYLLPK